MEYLIVAITVLFGAALTFFSGFGLGTLMLPVFSLLFPLPVAVGATAIVHLSNNIFKFGLVYKNIHYPTLLRFGIPAFFSALIGSFLLGYINQIRTIYSYEIGENHFEITLIKTILGALMVFFAWFDLSPRLSSLKLDEKWIPFGGFLSGFFGGISGHQGAFRSAFLAKLSLSKEQFIGTSNAIALIIDISRIFVYVKTLDFALLSNEKNLLFTGIVFAFIGTYFGKKLLTKTTMKSIQTVVGICLLLLGILFIAGII